MREKVEEKLLKVAGISRLEETHMTEQKGKWLVVTNKACKSQVKREVERIIKGVIFADNASDVYATRNYCERTSQSNTSNICIGVTKSR